MFFEEFDFAEIELATKSLVKMASPAVFNNLCIVYVGRRVPWGPWACLSQRSGRGRVCTPPLWERRGLMRVKPWFLGCVIKKDTSFTNAR